MLDGTDLVNVIKKIASNSEECSQPAEIVYGKVVKANPLEIKIDQKLTLKSHQLIVPIHLTDYAAYAMIQPEAPNADNKWKTEGEEDVENGHKHEIKNPLIVTIYNALAFGERVVLLRQRGGQKYLVIDRYI